MTLRPYHQLLKAAPLMMLALAALTLTARGLPRTKASASQASVVCRSADSAKIIGLLNEAKTLPRTTNFTLFFARKFIGVPYVAHTLEVAKEGEPLVVNTRQLDCTTFVETVAALTLCARRSLYRMEDFTAALASLRYRDGRRQGYTSRLHYFSDWIADNSRRGLVEEVVPDTQRITTAVQTLSVGYMSSHPKAYKALRLHPELIPVIRQQEQQLNSLPPCLYVPKSIVDTEAALRSMIHDGDILAITRSKAGLDIAHLGFAVWHADGLHLLNASQLHKQVVEEPMTLGQYLSRHPSHTGIRVVRIEN